VKPRSAAREGLARLRAAAASGELDAIAARHGLRVLTVFGSTAADDSSPEDLDPQDLDIGVLPGPGRAPDVVELYSDLVALAGTDRVDLAMLQHGGPVIRERALVGSIGLYESERGALARAGMAATLERMDTRWLRDLDLALMAEGADRSGAA
jgi:predicted nucleotidyltransferase